MYVILGATGNTGGATAEALLAKGEKIRAVGRSVARLQALAARGAETAVGDLSDASFLARTFDGADGVYVMVPPDYASPDPLGHYREVATAVARAVRSAPVRRLVVLSSLGAEHETGTGPIAGLHRLESTLAETGADQLHLRPGYFFENLCSALPLIRQAGVNGGAIAPEVRLPMTATHDIGAAVAEELTTGTFGGVAVRELTAAQELNLPEATQILGRAIGKPDLAYVRFPDADFAAALVGAGFSSAVAALFVEMAHAFNEGKILTHQARSPHTTAPTGFEAFVPTLAAAYAAG